jgi:DNA (cytosine-5)-methyltransferase 1
MSPSFTEFLQATTARPGEEIIVDSFAGGGGASTGIEMALGRSPDVAINHDGMALAMHAANHPATRHLSNNIWKVDPDSVEPGRPIGLFWASPDCTHHSKAKGGVPIRHAARNSRDLGWIVILWAKKRRPRVIILENVEEWRQWGPLSEDGEGKLRPDPARAGETFNEWVRQLRRLGYAVEWREDRASAHGAPTIRKRLFVIARCDGKAIVWPEPTHGDPKSDAVKAGSLRPWRTAAEIIDWSLPCPSIFMTREEARAYYRVTGTRVNRPLAEATMARIARGVKRYVIDAAEPFLVPVAPSSFLGSCIVPVTHAGDLRCNGTSEPLRTQTTAHRGEHALVTPFVTKWRQNSTGHRVDEPLHTVTAAHSETHPGGAAPLGIVTPFLAGLAHGDSGGRREYSVEEPLGTVQALGNNHAVVAPFMVPRYGERPGQDPRVASVDGPVSTIVPGGNGASLVAPVLSAYYGEGQGGDNRSARADEPLRTVTCDPRHALVAAFLAQHNTDMVGHAPTEPVSTIVGKGCTQGLVAAHMLNMKGSERQSYGAEEPLKTLCAEANHAAMVAAFLTKYYGSGGQWQDAVAPLHTVTGRDRVGLVTVTIAGEPYVIVDIGMRMLTARERFLAQGFPPDYRIDIEFEGRPLSGEAKGRMVGNSVCPPHAAALVRANCPEMARAG